MGKAKHSSSQPKTQELEFDVSPGLGGYSVVLFKGDQSLGAAPLNDQSYSFLKKKYQKHVNSSNVFKGPFSQAKSIGGGVQQSHKNISKGHHHHGSSGSIASAAALTTPAKPKRPLTETQRMNLQKGREARAHKLAEQRALKAASAASGSSQQTPVPVAPAPIAV